MTVLPENDRVEVHAEYMRRASDDRQPLPITKAQLRAAVDAVDAWVEANSASYNSALPVAARTNLTTRQKVLLLVYVVTRRFLREV